MCINQKKKAKKKTKKKIRLSDSVEMTSFFIFDKTRKYKLM